MKNSLYAHANFTASYLTTVRTGFVPSTTSYQNPVIPPSSHEEAGLLPVTFDGRRRRTKPLDALGLDGVTLRDKKLMQFRDQLVKRRKQLNMR